MVAVAEPCRGLFAEGALPTPLFHWVRVEGRDGIMIVAPIW